MVYCVGLTGNLASGKTTAAELFADLGIDVINADIISRELTEKNTPAYQSIARHFGPEILLADGAINRKSLREHIFTDANQRKWLEDLLHPLIRQAIEQNISHCKSVYCVIEIPLLLDTTYYPYLNRVLLIDAPQEVQIARVQERDKCSRDHALAILLAQPDINLRLKFADDVLNNDGDLHQLRHKIQALHQQYLTAASHD
jgi:dephospho-CoA kinase